MSSTNLGSMLIFASCVVGTSTFIGQWFDENKEALIAVITGKKKIICMCVVYVLKKTKLDTPGRVDRRKDMISLDLRNMYRTARL